MKSSRFGSALRLETQPACTLELQLLCKCCGQPYYPNKAWTDRLHAVYFGAERFAVCPVYTQALWSTFSPIRIIGAVVFDRCDGSSGCMWKRLALAANPVLWRGGIKAIASLISASSHGWAETRCSESVGLHPMSTQPFVTGE
jgi:hypothetical protein